jgi:hypothetical protein
VRRRIAIGGAAVVLAAVLVAIGVGGGSSTPTAPSSTIANAAAATAKLPGYRVSVTGSMSSATLGREIPLEGSGVIAAHDHAAALDMTMSGVPGLSGGKMTMHEVMSGFVMYMRSPLFEGKLPDGKSWLKVDLRKATQEFGIDPSEFTSDPTKALDQLRAVSGRVERLGADTVRGVRTTHYRATVHLRRYPDLVPADRRAEARKGVDKLIALIGRSKFPQEVWIDAQRHIRRVGLDMTYRVATAPGKPTVSMKMVEDLYDFGTRVPVDIPSDDDAYDATKLAQQGVQGALPAQ